MRKAAAIFLALVAMTFFSVNADQGFKADQTFGAAMPEAGEAMPLKAAIIAMASAKPEQLVKIQGQVTEVCQAKGCWMILVDGDTYARITFEDYGFFVPIETSMQRSIVYGVLTEHVLTGEQADHFAQDAGSKSTLELKGEVKEYSIVARAVQLENRS